ncbi:MAG: tRNA (adenosine(37)-N6)-threonylcarbamoyltransferase complex dimerization subunit type 1 TsaB [Erysipelotrichia bacterium]|nr:tRNA (adenosine(37)-N6)-threonylcarbamoyltransferase complex dimerization subunit type 1 TsaB [Erysipelotrichia bacterium]
MITLCMDTSSKYLAIGLIKDDKLIQKVQESCWKRQSEELFPKLQMIMEAADLQPENIDRIVITKGPGSYTGVRIAMTVSKVFCAMKNLPLYTISTLQLYAGMAEHCRVLLDARGGRAYTAVYDKAVLNGEESVLSCEEILKEIRPETVIAGDGHLVGREDFWPDLCENFLILKDQWQLADNVHLVVPEYLKTAESYMPKAK